MSRKGFCFGTSASFPLIASYSFTVRAANSARVISALRSCPSRHSGISSSRMADSTRSTAHSSTVSPVNTDAAETGAAVKAGRQGPLSSADNHFLFIRSTSFFLSRAPPGRPVPFSLLSSI